MKAETAWKWMPAVLLGLTLVFAAWRVQLALGDPHFAAVEDYYQKSMDWDEQQRLRQASQDLHWAVVLLPVRPRSEGVSEVEFQVQDQNGQPVEGVQGSLRAFHNGYPSQAVECILQPIPGGRLRAKITFHHFGLWRWQLNLEKGDARWIGDLREYVNLPEKSSP